MDPYETKIYYVFLISVMVIGLVIFYYLFSVIRMQAIHRRSYLHKLGQQVSMLESERKRISENLHDDLAPIITAAKMQFSSIDPASPQQYNNLGKGMQHLENLMEKMRGISSDLLPNVLLHKGVIAALEEYVFNLGQVPGTPELTLDTEDLSGMRYERSVNLYRILQEIIHNTCKHAKAARLHISIYKENDQVMIATIDDGIGFNFPVELKQAKGIGLTGIAGRVQLLGGYFYVDDTKGHGTKFFICIPFQDP